jgi:hypothetical protein
MRTMTNPNDPWSNPYGQPGQPGQPGQQGPQGQPQYTQPLYGGPESQHGGQQHGQPPQYGQPQYGQPQYGPPQYGDQPYGGPPQYGPGQYGPGQYGPGQYGPGMQPYGTPPFGAGARPSSGTLVTAGVIQIVQSAFWVIIGVIFIAVASALTNLLRDAGVTDTAGDAKSAAIAGGLVIIAVAAAMIVLAVLMMRRSNGCRIASIVLQILFAVFYLLATVSAINNQDSPAFPLVFVISCIAVVVLLLTASAKAATRSS